MRTFNYFCANKCKLRLPNAIYFYDLFFNVVTIYDIIEYVIDPNSLIKEVDCHFVNFKIIAY